MLFAIKVRNQNLAHKGLMSFEGKRGPVCLQCLKKHIDYPQTFLHNCCKPVSSWCDTLWTRYRLLHGFAVVPYILGVREPIKGIWASFNVKVAQNIFRHGYIFTKSKDHVPKKQRTHSAYLIPCKDCKHVYIRQTKVQFSTRFTEHQKKGFLCKNED